MTVESFGLETLGDVEGFPGTVFFVLAEADAVLAQGAHAAAVQDAGPLLEDVDEDEADGAADGGVGAVAGTEEVVGAVEAQLVADGAVDEHENADGVGHRRKLVDAVGVVVEEGLHRGENDGEILGEAAGHNRVGGGLLGGEDAAADGDFAQDVVGGQAHVVEHLLDALNGWGDHR